MTGPATRPSTDPAGHRDGGGSELEAALGYLEHCELVPPTQRERVGEARRRLADLTVVVAVVGDFNRGKSSVVNALLGAAALPTGALPVTGVPTVVRWSERPSLVVATQTDRAGATWPPERLREAVTERDNPGNRAGVVEARLGWPADLLRLGLVVVDLPGTGSVHAHNTATATAFFPRIDAALMVLSADAPLSAAELLQMRELSGTVARIGVCVNKVDHLDPQDRRETVAYVRRRMDETLGDTIPLFAVSAHRALQAGGDDGIAAVRRWLVDEVAAARREILAARALAAARAARAEAVSALHLEQASLSLPEEMVASHSRQLGLAVAALRRSSTEAKTLFRHACQTTVTAVVEPAADRLRSALAIRLAETGDRRRWPGVQTESADAWGEQLLEEMERSLAPPAARFADQVRSARERFLSDASELFAVELPRPPDPAEVVTLARARIDSSDVAGALAAGLRGMRAHAPGALGRRWRDRARRDDAAEIADRLAGRLRHAAQGVLDGAADAWSRHADDAIDGIVTALTDALERARASALAGHRARCARQSRLAEVARELDGLSGPLREARATGPILRVPRVDEVGPGRLHPPRDVP